MLSRTNPTIVEMYTGLTTKWFYASFCVLRGKGSYFSIVLAVRSRSSYYCVLRAPSPWLGIVRVGAELGPETPAERSVGARSRYPDPGHINDVASASWDHCLGAQFIVGSKRGQGCT
jgi:hypothetical protein